MAVVRPRRSRFMACLHISLFVGTDSGWSLHAVQYGFTVRNTFHTMDPSSPPIAGDVGDDASGGVIAVRRAMRILEAFGVSDAQLTLAELSRRTGFHKTTVLRLARTLATDDYLVQKEDGSWRLGRAGGWLGACYQATFNVYE